MIEARRNLVPERTQIVNREHTLTARAQVVHRRLQRLARKVLIHVLGKLIGREVCAGAAVLDKRLVVKREEGRFATDRAFHALAAAFARRQVVARGQQFRGAQLVSGVALNLFLSQVFHWFSVLTFPRGFEEASPREVGESFRLLPRTIK